MLIQSIHASWKLIEIMYVEMRNVLIMYGVSANSMN